MERRGFVAAILGLVVALGACAPVPPRVVDATPLVWPEGVDAPARIAFDKAFSRPEEFGIEKGFLERIGEFLFGQRDARLVRPMAVVAVKGVVYVADPGAKGVHRFDPIAKRYDLIGAEGDAPLPSPIGLARGRRRRGLRHRLGAARSARDTPRRHGRDPPAATARWASRPAWRSIA